MTDLPRQPGPYRALIEEELRRRVETARSPESPAPVDGPLALRCTSCGHLNGYRAPACQRCAIVFNASLVWLPGPAPASGEVMS